MARLLPGAEDRYKAKWQQGKAAYEYAVRQWQATEQARQRRLVVAKEEHERNTAAVKEQHARIDELDADYRTGKRAAVEHALGATLAGSSYPSDFPHNATLIYRTREKELLVEYEFPLADDVIPAEASYRYIRSKASFEVKKRIPTEKSRLYKSILAQVTLRTLYELFNADESGHVERIAFNGVVQGYDPTTGRPARPKLVSVRTTRQQFLDRDFARIDPQKALQSLRANFSAAPTELEPIPPVLEFDVNDPRFIDEEEILSGLDERTNLIDLTPGAFETVIRDLFQAMGFDTYQTRPSRDGGVDCVAHYQKSVIGGKYIIQAKKYVNVVPVEAVRDLAGALDHERASKGILVTTSDFTRAGEEFAQNKPIELINGNSLLALIKEYTNLEMKIVMPPKKGR
jgi:restriction system protein